MSSEQYRYVSDQLLHDRGCKLLVFGLGHDSRLSACAGVRLAFVEDNPTYLTAAPAESAVIIYEFNSRVAVWFPIPDPPRQLIQEWDYVLVDGPAGFNSFCPGRQIPIAWARLLASKQVFVHDYERPWERQVCDKLLGTPLDVLKPDSNKRGELAIFDVKLMPRM